jgi:uncharacterized peroxidase-related enzyme
MVPKLRRSVPGRSRSDRMIHGARKRRVCFTTQDFSMPRITAIARNNATPQAGTMLDAVQQQLGITPNLFKTLGHSPAGLQSLVAQISALGNGTLDARARALVALAVAGTNHCDYCASAHTALGQMAKVPVSELAQALKAESPDSKVNAALRFAKSVVDARGNVSDSELAAVKASGWSDGQVLEIVANVAMNVFTNYVNLVAQTEIDFPRVATR